MKLSELKAIAERATPGPWIEGFADGSGKLNEDWSEGASITNGLKSPDLEVIVHGGPGPEGVEWKKDCDFITAFHPALALELIGLIEQSREHIEALMGIQTGKIVDYADSFEKARSFLEALRTWEGS